MKNNEREISQFDLFTGGKTKTADMAIYYNMAVKNIEKIINFYEKKSEPGKKEDLNSKEIEITAIRNESTFGHLAEYIWKAHTNMRNGNGVVLTKDDKSLIQELYAKLNSIRHYHSHIWHNHEVLAFNDILVNFVNEKYAMAMAKAYEADSQATVSYEQNLHKKKELKHDLFFAKNGKKYITEEGRVFFLSFFLTTGQMSSFLQQRKGSKRNDIPLFKTKHYVYKYYCHRDGASIMGFHHNESILEDMSMDDKKDILLARQAYKLITYLHDYPEYLANNELMPLLLPTPEHKEKVKKVNNIQDLLAVIKSKNILPECTFTPITFIPKDNNEDTKQVEEMERTGTVLMDYKGIDSYRFQINFYNLYKLVIIRLKCGKEKIDGFKANLEALAENRRNLYEILMQDPNALTNDEQTYLLETTNQYLRGSRILTENGVAFFEEYSKKLKGKDNARVKLANYIRPDGTHWHELPKTVRGINNYAEHEAEPIIIFAQDFIEKTEQKFRMGNRFMFYAAKYLIDHNVVPDWHWEIEKFEMVKKDKAAINAKDLALSALPPTTESLIKIKTLKQQIPDGYRLSIENDHVTIGILKNKTQTINADPKKRHEAFYQFSIGPKAMRYFLAIHATKLGANLNDFLAVAIKTEFENVVANAWTGEYSIQLLEEQFLPGYLKPNKLIDSFSTHLKKIKQRVDFIIQEWDKTIGDIKQLKRAEKNKIILDAYRLFDWENNGNVKFLRANEYKYISVCHYSLKDKIKKHGERESKFDYLFNSLFALNKRKPPIPAAIRELLDNSDNLDALLGNVIKNRKAYLKNEIDLLSILPSKPRKEKTIAFGKKIGLSIPDELLNEGLKEEQQTKRAKTLAVLPFAIHPILVMKHFMNHLYKENYTGHKEKSNDIFKNLRKPTFTDGLHKEHYDISYLTEMVQTDNNETNKIYEKQFKKWIGIINTTQTEDAILWWVAKKYLSNNQFTKNMEIALFNNKMPKTTTDVAKQPIAVGNLYKQAILMPLNKLKDGNNEDDTEKKTVYMHMMMHQVDDVMFFIDKEQLRRAALHYLRRNNEEHTFWKTIVVTDTAGADSKEIIYTGTKDDPIPYETLRKEIQLISRHAMNFAEHLLDWERDIIIKYGNEKTAAQKQTDLITQTSKNNSSSYDHINFKKIIELSGIKQIVDTALLESINKYRYQSFHSGIPVTGSYAWITRKGTEFNKAFGIDFLIHRIKDTNRFIVAQ